MGDAETDEGVLRRLAVLLGLLAAVCLAAGASRMRPAGWELRTFGDILRVREALSMFVYAPVLGVLFWMLSRAVGRGRVSASVGALLVLAVYFIACGMGMHDPTNRMVCVYRGTGALSPEVRRTLVYLDDQLGHWVFWAGFVLATWVLGVQQALAPLRERMGRGWRVFFGAISAALLWVMLTNLWDEYPQTRADLCVIATAAAAPLAAHLAFSRKTGLWRLPLLLVIYPAYFGSIAGTLARWLARYGKMKGL